MPDSSPGSIPRRHDLDALRAIAMLLGIALHGAMSFIPGIGIFWGVADTQANEVFGVFLAAVHGFRMPLFFLISGFFTAMLWRKRGLEALLQHRFKRIFLPMVIALFTIIPATWIISAYVKSNAEADRSANVVRGQPDNSTNDKEMDILGAAAADDIETVKLLIEQGVNLDTQNVDGSTALHAAVFFGRTEVTELLLDAGADTESMNNNGERPIDGVHAPWGITKFIADMVNIEISQEELNLGREQIVAVFKERGIAVGEAPSDADKLAGLVKLLMFFPLFGHLWFLWFLCWLVLGFTVSVTIGKSLGIRAVPQWMTLSVWRFAWLLPLTAVLQSFMGQAGNSFGPDTSIGLIPLPAVLGYYAIFFGFGAFYFAADDCGGRVGRLWWLSLPVALFVIFPIGLAAGTSGETASRGVFVVSQVVYAWLVTFGMIGLFRRWCSGESRTMRYVSDSSYWLYLAHIPLVIFIQFLVRDWSMSAFIKFPLVCAVTSGVLLISYQLFVRYTPIGTLLNGPRQRVGKREEAVDAIVLDVDAVGEASSI